MDEVVEVKRQTNPHEVLLVADALTGQDAVNTARAFDGRVGITGIVLTRVDGDGRGGAALSMRAVTGKPIKLMGVGEKSDALEDFHPSRIADRILGMGDIVALVEKAAANIDAEKAAKMAKKMQKGEFDLDDLADQLKQMQKLGGMSGIMGLMPGMAKMKGQLASAGFDDKHIKRQIAIVQSMTKLERAKPAVLDARRKRRVAAGSGTDVSEINKLLKTHRQMADMMKKMGKQKGGMLGKLMGGMGGGMPDLSQVDPATLDKVARDAGLGGPDAMKNAMKGLPGGLPPGLGGMGGGLPKLPGLPGFGKGPKGR
ncbi:Signal recognition particle protein [Methylobrevis pamukkalensis]|uniref:Signal recognition particle protein n=1 Tax=Methylobrevis pamukkalensis TaxID=1439726 RepID=A0A1E3GZ36_9HYPH|nr:Signal recognition particle protein [Methylobrevis pamukkalensis]